MTADRYARWVRASRLFARIEHSLVSAVQWLGRLDVQQIKEDQRYLNLSGQLKATDDEIRRFSDHYTMSYLWVLESHKLLRTLAKRMRENVTLVPSDVLRLIGKTEHIFERVLIPLTKQEPTRQKGADSHIFSPALNRSLGIGWQVSSGDYITRRELSDAFLGLMERILQGIQKAETEVSADSNVSTFLETREELRTEYQQAIKYVTSRFAGDTVCKGVTINLSRSGMCLITFHQLEEGQQVSIKNGLKVSNSSTVRWVKKLDKDIYKVGLQIASVRA